jgi:6-phosphogluconolactonase
MTRRSILTEAFGAGRSTTRRSVLQGLGAIPLAAVARGWAQKVQFAARPEALVYVGTYTGKGSDGIYVYRWHARAGELESLGLAAKTENPSFLSASGDGAALYAANEISTFRGKPDGSISGFQVDRATGKLTAGTVVSSGGPGPCQVSLSRDGRMLFTADYDGGSAAACPVLGPARTGEPVWNPHYQGHGPNAKRQEGAHIHCSTVSPDNRWVLFNDLGRDQIMVYALGGAVNGESSEGAKAGAKAGVHSGVHGSGGKAGEKAGEKAGAVHGGSLEPSAQPSSVYQAAPGSGPRSFAFHPNGRWAYSTNELANTVDVLRWDAAHGVLTRSAAVSTLPADFHGESTAASVVVSPDGRFVYVSNRDGAPVTEPGNDSIAVFTVGEAGGALTPLDHTPTGGRIPRHFALDPTGHWLVVAHQESASLVVLPRDPGTGRLKNVDRKYEINQPTCVLFC